MSDEARNEHLNNMLDERLDAAGRHLYDGSTLVEVPTWQALDVRESAQGRTLEICDYSLQVVIPNEITDIGQSIPWAENQFKERVGGEPLNPGETYKEWPWYFGNVETHKEQGKFSHTYMERYWPKHAYDGNANPCYQIEEDIDPMGGIRFHYGDLGDVVNLLAREPTTRQAYLPVFFPEDTGAVHRQRIPCSLGYLFLMREGKLNITYYIRSCDFYRHFRDDVYMTARLCQWVLEQLQGPNDDVKMGEMWDNVVPGHLTMHIGSLHVFEGDLPKLRREYGTN